MKQCPSCKTTYTDDSLQFCLSDGTNLIFVPTEANTVQMKFGGGEPLRVNIPADSAPTVFAPSPPIVYNQPVSQNQPKKKGFGLIVAGLFAVLLLSVVGLVAAYVMLRPRENQAIVTAAPPSPTVAPKVSPSATPNDEAAKLREEMANLKKQLETQKNQKQGSPLLPVPPPTDGSKTAYANSPTDGFLALRSEPNSETGYRIAKIPHGAALTVLGCPKASNVGKMAGRWCQVDYNGQSGWAFDRFMKF